jgi:DNA polymerase IV
MGPGFVEALPVERFHGIGPATAAKMKELGIFTALDLRTKDEAFLLRYFGEAGPHFYCICRGIDHRPVLPNRVRKSIGAENTFAQDLMSLDDMRAELGPLVEKVWHYCDTTGMRGRTVTLKVKFADFQIITRSRSLAAPLSDRLRLASVSAELLTAQFPMAKEFVFLACRSLHSAPVRQMSVHKWLWGYKTLLVSGAHSGDRKRKPCDTIDTIT